MNLKELVRLENEEVSLRDRMARLQGGDGEHAGPEFARLSEVQQSLDTDQAMLYFELRWDRTEREGSLRSRSFVCSDPDPRQGSAPTSCPASRRSRPRWRMFEGLLQEDPASLERPAARLFQELLGEAMRSLPDDTKRLVIVPDDPLHRLPFEMLREPDQVVPVGVRYAISYVPSATAWMRWERTPVENASDMVLSLADPALETSGLDGAPDRSTPWESGSDGRTVAGSQDAKREKWRIWAGREACCSRERVPVRAP